MDTMVERIRKEVGGETHTGCQQMLSAVGSLVGI